MLNIGTVISLIKQYSGADPAVIESAVQDWLDDHPEATTTVTDGSITMAKLASAVAQKVNQVTSLSDEIANFPYVNVKSLGAVGDGETDDTTALQSALTQHKKIYIPSGTYLINATLQIGSNTEIMGDGESTIIQLGDNPALTPYQWSTNYGDDNYFYPFMVADQKTSVFVHDLKIIGNLETEDEHTQTGLCFFNSTECYAENLTIDHINYFPDNSLPRPSGQWRRGWGLSMFDCTNVYIAKCNISYSPYENLRVGKNSKHVVVSDCVLEYGWRTGLQILRGCDDITVLRCRIVQDDFDKYDTEACITLHSGENAYISNVLIKDCTLFGELYEAGSGVANAISFIDGYTNNIVIDNCTIICTGTSNGLALNGEKIEVRNCNVVCDGNGIMFNAQRGVSNVALIDSVIKSSSLGVYVTSTNKHDTIILSGNIIESTGNHVCYIDNNGNSKCMIKGNTIKSAATKNGVHFTANTIANHAVITGNSFLAGNICVKATTATHCVIATNNCIGCTTATDAPTADNMIANNLI